MAVKKLSTKKFRNLGIYGVVRETEVDDYLIPEGALTEAKNVHFDRKGAITLRLGMANLGGTVSTGYPCLGMHNVLASTMLATFSDGTNNDIYRYNGSTWSKCLEDDTADSKTRFADFAGRTIRVNGIDSSIKCWNGIADGASYWDSTGDPINPDDMWGYEPKFIEIYKSRCYVSGDSTYPDRLFYSSIISSSGNITWTPDEGYVDINPSDGENITALKRFSLELLVFKPNYIYRFRTTAVDPDPLIKIGTRSQESVVEGKKGMYFHHDSGIFKYSGGYPMEISRPISDFINAIPMSYRSEVSSWRDEDHIYFSVGDLTVEGSSWTNVILRYTESSEVWTIYSMGKEIKWGSDYNDGSNLYRMVGSDDGFALKFGSGYTDNGTAISYTAITKWYEIGNIWDKKTLQYLIALCEKAQASKLMYQVDEKEEWNDLGQLREYITHFKQLAIDCHRIRFKLTGMSSNEPFIFQGIEIVEGLVESLTGK